MPSLNRLTSLAGADAWDPPVPPVASPSWFAVAIGVWGHDDGRVSVDPLLPNDPAQVGAYRLLGRVGGGYSGQVFLGRSPEGRHAAVKLINPDYAYEQDFKERFTREIQAARRVCGPHTAPVLDADIDADPPWMATAYIPGPSLADTVAEHGRLIPDAVRALGAGLAEGLSAVHVCGLVHHDLHPRSVIMAGDGPYITDFGLSRALDIYLLDKYFIIHGAYVYMSPEQVLGRPAGPASDVFCLGSVLVYAATGHAPFGTDPVGTVLRIAGEPPDLTGLCEDHGLRELLTACLAKNSGDRPTVTEVITRLTKPRS